MKFPKIADIASTSVIQVPITSTIMGALDIMFEQNHRNIVVIDKDCFRIMTTIDILTIRKDNLDLKTPLSKINLSKIPMISKEKNILDILKYLDKSNEYICVINPDQSLYGLVTLTDITNNIDPESLMNNYKLVNLMRLGYSMTQIKKETITATLFKEMIDQSLDNVIIVEDKKPIGILTTKDILRIIKQKDDLEVAVSHYMSSPVDTMSQDASIKEALSLIKQKYYKRIVIVDKNGDLLDIITQQELISLSYSGWAILMKEHYKELIEINNILIGKNQEYQAIISTDSLTGLYNHYKFSELYKSTQTAMKQTQDDASIILLDIDFFKKINDLYGHSFGDQVLIQIAHVLLRSSRDIDIVCRWSGEEFIILLPSTSLSDASLIAEKLRISIEKMEIEGIDSLTASFGISRVTKSSIIQDVISKANKALYTAKESGKNCVKTELDY